MGQAREHRCWRTLRGEFAPRQEALRGREKRELLILVEVQFALCFLRLEKGTFQPPEGYDKRFQMQIARCYER